MDGLVVGVLPENNPITEIMRSGYKFGYDEGYNDGKAYAMDRLKHVARERDAAVKCLSEFAPCSECACYKDNGGNCSGKLYCKSHDTGFAWQWRGVKVEG